MTDNVNGCPCHGSGFDGADGSVVQGPAEQTPARLAIVVDGTSFAVD